MWICPHCSPVCSCSLLMQIPGYLRLYPLGPDHETGHWLIRFDGACCFGSSSEILPRPISAQRRAQAAHIWNNPPAPLESGSIRGTQTCFSWPVSKQLTSRIMHHFLWLSRQQMDNVIIFVSHLSNTVPPTCLMFVIRLLPKYIIAIKLNI